MGRAATSVFVLVGIVADTLCDRGFAHIPCQQ